ncbi:tRNA (adenosine(37)-N6)-dimethylallyltransferase MiaA [Nesterenkonia sp. LB17]|uniref:tRNA (adenosine(37)-N6)-dimethylallyltransferase MiaA n=1 Tax=Nesterenkonia sp. LB17 TaxID=2901230 RepID=UPI00351D66FE
MTADHLTQQVSSARSDAARQTAPLIVLVGPTASGKSALGIDLAERLDGEIINADSMQLYRGMDIGTAKVTQDEAGAVPHHLLDVLDVTEEASVADFQDQARRIIGEIRARGKTPIMVGGSGLYVRAVIDVIEFPPTDAELRSRLTLRLDDEGAAPLRQELRELDPESAAVIKDDRRLIRALEVVLLTGRTFSSYMPQRRHEPGLEPVVQIGLDVDRPLLHERIAHRVQRMADQDLLEEVRQLDDAGLRRGRTASRAIGYQQFLQVLDGELTPGEAIESTTVATRRFARRQETWFRADPRVTWLPAPSQDLTQQAQEAIHRALR